MPYVLAGAVYGATFLAFYAYFARRDPVRAPAPGSVSA